MTDEKFIFAGIELRKGKETFYVMYLMLMMIVSVTRMILLKDKLSQCLKESNQKKSRNYQEGTFQRNSEKESSQ